MSALDAFIKGYVACLLWSSTDDSGTPLDQRFTPDDLSDDAKSVVMRDCSAFFAAYSGWFENKSENAGHDFWLTRNHHGAGFWDGDWKAYGKELTIAAHRFSGLSPYVADGKVFLA